MNTKPAARKRVEARVSSAQRGSQLLRPDRQRVLELKDGDSFLLRTMLIDEDTETPPRWRYRSAPQIANRLAIWARKNHVLVAYLMLDKHTVRVWRLGAI